MSHRKFEQPRRGSLAFLPRVNTVFYCLFLRKERPEVKEK